MGSDRSARMNAGGNGFGRPTIAKELADEVKRTQEIEAQHNANLAVFHWRVVFIDGHQYFECDRCGSLVANTVKHVAHHQKEWRGRLVE